MKFLFPRTQLFTFFLFVLIFSVAFTECKEKRSSTAPVERRKTSDYSTSLDSIRLLLSNARTILSNAFGPQIDSVFDEFDNQFQKIGETADMLESLRDPTVIKSINSLIETVFTGLEESIKTHQKALSEGSFVSGSAFGKLLNSYEDKLVASISSTKGISKDVKDAVLFIIHGFFENMVKIYSQISSSSGFGIPGFLLLQYLPIILAFKSNAFVTTDTFKHVSNLRTEFTQAFEEFVGENLTPDKINMLNFLLTMLSQQLPKARREEHQDL